MLFPVVVLLGLNGLCVGILNAYNHFTVPALAPLVWNIVIIVTLLVVLRPLFEGDDQLYAYAIGVLAGTIVQFLMAFPVLRYHGFQFTLALDWRDPRVRRVIALMIPVTIGLGVINFDLVINSTLGSLVSDQAPRAIDAAFRLYQLPQGMFSIALATVLFPALARATRSAATSRCCAGPWPTASARSSSCSSRRGGDTPCSRRRSCGSSTSTASSARTRPTLSPRRWSGSPWRCRSTARTCS